jgi:hypothetical protein
MIKIYSRSDVDMVIHNVLCCHINKYNGKYDYIGNDYIGNGDVHLKYRPNVTLKEIIKLSIHEIKLLKKYDMYDTYKITYKFFVN